MKEFIQTQQSNNIMTPLQISFKHVSPEKDNKIDKIRESQKIKWFEDLQFIIIVSYVLAILIGTACYFYIDGVLSLYLYRLKYFSYCH